MHLIVRFLRNIILGAILAVGLPTLADDFRELAIYDEVQIEAESIPDAQVANDIHDAIGGDADQPEENEFANATPEPEYNAGFSKLANQLVKKKVAKKTKKKKAKGKRRTLARK